MICPALNYDVKLIEWAMFQVERPFEWGSTDCGTLVREAMIIMFDCDLFARQYRRYTTEVGAKAALAKVGTIRKALENAGFARVKGGVWSTGDIVIVPGNARQNCLESAGVFMNRRVLMSHHKKGVHWCPREGLPKNASRFRLVQ